LAECRTDFRVAVDRQSGKSPQLSLCWLVTHYFSWRERHFSLPCQTVGPSLSRSLSVQEQ
jgi:hypothetical protein